MDKWKTEAGSIEQHRWDAARALFDSWAVNDDRTCDVIREVFESTEYLIDPHTAIGVEAARQCRRNDQIPMITLATAHPAKFPEAVAKSGLDVTAQLPHHLTDLFEREERYEVLPKDLSKVQAYVAKNRRKS